MLCEEVSPSLSALIPSLYLHIDPSILLIVLEIPRRCTIPAPNPGHRVAVLLRPIPFLSPRPFRNPLTLESLRLSRINLGNDFHRRIVARFCGKTGATTCLEFYFELLKKKKQKKRKEKKATAAKKKGIAPERGGQSTISIVSRSSGGFHSRCAMPSELINRF